MLPHVRVAALLAALVVALATACAADTGERHDSSSQRDDATATSDGATGSTDASDVAAATDLTDLADRTLVVTEMTRGGEPHPIVEGTQIRFNFTEHQVSVETGCNHLGATWEREGDTLSFAQMMATEMGCPEERAAQEELLARALDGPVVVEDGTLVAGDLVFTVVDRETVSPDLDVAGQRWHLDALVDDQSVSSLPRGVKAWIELDGSTLMVDTGCNHGHGAATLEGDTLTVEGIGLTRMACTGDRGEVEQHVLAVLRGAVHARVRERTLTLTGTGGKALVFTARGR